MTTEVRIMKIAEFKEQNILCIIRWLIVFAFLFITGCTTILTNQPLSDPWTAEPDQSLYGHWFAKQADGEEVDLYIGKGSKSPESIMEFVKVLYFAKKSELVVDQPWTGYISVSRINGSSYMNILIDRKPEDKKLSYRSNTWHYEDWIKNPSKLVSILKYRVTGDKLMLWGAKDGEILERKTREAKDIKILYKYKNESIVDSTSLVRYLHKNGGEDLFDTAVSFIRVP